MWELGSNTLPRQSYEQRLVAFWHTTIPDSTKINIESSYRLTISNRAGPVGFGVSLNLKRTLFVEEAMSDCSFEIVEDPFDSREMRSPGLLKKPAYLVDDEGYLRSGPSKILYGADEGFVFSDIGKEITTC